MARGRKKMKERQTEGKKATKEERKYENGEENPKTKQEKKSLESKESCRTENKMSNFVTTTTTTLIKTTTQQHYISGRLCEGMKKCATSEGREGGSEGDAVGWDQGGIVVKIRVVDIIINVVMAIIVIIITTFLIITIIIIISSSNNIQRWMIHIGDKELEIHRLMNM